MKVVNIRTEPSTHYIGRGSIAGNPFTHLPLYQTTALVQVGSREESIDTYRQWLTTKAGEKFEFHRRKKLLEWIDMLPEDAVLGCYCKPLSCHGDVIMEIWDAS